MNSGNIRFVYIVAPSRATFGAGLRDRRSTVPGPDRRESLTMRTIRFPISGLMGAVLVAALGLAALRNASETWAGIIFLLTCAVLGLAIVGIICRGDGERAW